MASSFVLEQGQGLATKQRVRVHGFVSSRGIMAPSLGRQYQGERVEKATSKRPLSMVTSVKVSFEVDRDFITVIFLLTTFDGRWEASGYDVGPLPHFVGANVHVDHLRHRLSLTVPLW